MILPVLPNSGDLDKTALFLTLNCCGGFRQIGSKSATVGPASEFLLRCDFLEDADDFQETRNMLAFLKIRTRLFTYNRPSHAHPSIRSAITLPQNS